MIITAGDAQGFTDTYLEGLALQCQSQRTVGKDTSDIFEQVLPYELFMKVFSYLSVQDLCTTSVVCKVIGLILTHVHAKCVHLFVGMVHYVYGWTVVVPTLHEEVATC